MDKIKLQKILKFNHISTEILNIEDESIDYLYGLLNGLEWIFENFNINPNGACVDEVIEYLKLKVD
jgi:hypothetical protein